MKTNSYTWACPYCPVWIEEAVTTEHLERAMLQHIDDAHPEYHLIARHAIAMEHRPLSLFDTIETPDDATTTRVECGAAITIEPPDPESTLLRFFISEHVARHAETLRDGRAS